MAKSRRGPRSKRNPADDQSGLEQSFGAALKAAQSAPDSDDAWDHLEDLVEQLQRPDEAAEVYRGVLESRLPRDVFTTVAERAVQFHDEWFGDTPERISELLTRIIELEPAADWAFERLVVMLTSAGQWDELLTVYDRTLATTQEPKRKRQLLNDAAQTAKDFADDPHRAASYMQELLKLEPDNDKLFTSLERLLSKQGRFTDLIELWHARLPQLSTKKARATQVRIATAWLDQLKQPARALEVLRELVQGSPGHKQACEQLERILGLDEAEMETRREALSLLRKNYVVAERPDDVIRVLGEALAFVDADEKRTLHREIAGRLGIVGRDEEAIGHYRALLMLDATDPDARKQLRQLARRAGRVDLHAEALMAAAEASEGATKVAALLDAARLKERVLEDTEGAIELYLAVLGNEEADAEVALSAAHRLDELLARAERPAERLTVLEKLATVEPSKGVRRHVLGEAARLAETLGDADRALANWQPVLSEDPHDVEALAAKANLLERNERWAELVQALAQRAGAKVLPSQRRADLIRVASIQADKVSDLNSAIDTWLQVRDEFGLDDQVTAALDDLMARAERWADLVNILGGAATREHSRVAQLLARLGELYRSHVAEPAQALTWYERALAIDPAHDRARQGLAALLEEEGVKQQAASSLARAYERQDEWQQLLELLEMRLAAATNNSEQTALLREAATLYETRAGDATAALNCLCRALPLQPSDLVTESRIRGLAESTGDWPVAATALSTAAQQLTDQPTRVAQLHKASGAIYETWVGDYPAAVAAYEAAVAAVPDDLEAHDAIARCGARSKMWGSACKALVATVALRDRIVSAVMNTLEAAAESPEDWHALASGMAAAIVEAALHGELAQQLEVIVAGWFRDHCNDLDAAQQAAARAAEHGAGKLSTLELLATLQRRNPDTQLLATLQRIDVAREHSLDPLYEAARVALDLEDGERALSILERLYRKAAGMWLRNEPASGEHGADEIAQWALDSLIAQHIVAGDNDRAVNVLLDGTRLPLPAAKIAELRRRAAEMLVERGDLDRAIAVYRRLLSDTAEDTTTLSQIAALCEQQGRVVDALTMRTRELQLTQDAERKIQLRLDCSRLTGMLEKAGGRVESLQQNLQDAPGHQDTIDALAAVLEERGRYPELTTLFEEQAAALKEQGEQERAAGNWRRAASIAESNLKDELRAIGSLTQVVELAPTNEALDTLARLHTTQEQPAAAARWLEQRLSTTSQTERVAVLLKLARSRIAADQRDGAVTALSSAFDEAPRNAEVRKLLLRMHRANKDWQALADTLARAALNISDEDTVLSYAREAAEIYHQRLDSPDRSVDVLRKAITIAPDERKLRAMLAEGLRLAGELDEAKELLEELIKKFGRRRSAERAQAHLQLARVHHAQGDIQSALDQLETASKMDSRNVNVLKTLADLAQEAGELDRAERAYRTLLVTVRRESDRAALPTGPSEVLLELSRLAAQRGDSSKADDLTVSALESLAENDHEAPRIQDSLRQRGENDLLLRVLEARSGYIEATHKRAQVLGQIGTTLIALERQDEAFDKLLEAVKADPSSPVLHQQVRDQAAAQNKLDAYVTVLEMLLNDQRADKSAHVRCELLLRLGEVLEKDHNDLERAAELYAQAESTGVRKVDVWRAESRIAGARGDTVEQMRLLELLASLGEDEADTRAAALYRIAEVQLASDETLDEGLESLNNALADDFRAERAAMILQRAAEHHPDHPGLLDTYEQVARRSSDDKLLLHYLQQRARQDDATVEHAREAVDKSLALGEHALAEELMLRAAEIGQEGQREDDLAKVDWALLGLAERRLDAGDLASAVKWLSEAAEVAALEPVFALAQRVLELAQQPDGDLTLAAKLYERLVERAPTVREAWQPLAEIYARLDSVERLENLVAERLDGLEEARDRNALRVSLAHALLRASGREEDAVDILKTVLFEEADNVRAQSLLVDYLDKAGKSDELVELLNQQLDNAEERGDGPSVKAAALRLAKRIEAEDRDQALNALRRASDANPEDLELLLALNDRLTDEDDTSERALLMERMIGLEPAETAGQRALALVDLYASLDDDDGVLRALELGAQRDPDNKQLRERLMGRFREVGDYAGLANSLTENASLAEDPAAKAALLREAAEVYRDHLSDAGTAADLLRQAHELGGGDNEELSLQLALTLSAAGDHDQAITTLTQMVDGATEPAHRLRLLRTRAKLLSAAENDDGALADLEQAFELAPEEVAEELEAMLQQGLDSAAVNGDEDRERYFTLRCVDVLLMQGKREQASELLASWADRSPDDVQTLRRLRDLDTEDGRWQAVADTCRRLIAIETGSAQIDAALALAHAYYELGEPEGAREGLEYAREHQPDNPQVRTELRKIYERLGDRRQLAVLLMDDAATTEDPTEKLALLSQAGQLFVEVGDTEAALPALQSALQLNPDDQGATLTLVDAYVLAGWYDDASELLDGVIEESKGRRTPDMCLFYHRKAHIAGAQGDKTTQMQYLQEAHLSSKKNGIVAADLANLAEEMQDWDLAAKTLRTITLIDGECPISRAEAFLRQGRIALMQGDDKSARMWARRARREEPDSEEVEAFIQELGD